MVAVANRVFLERLKASPSPGDAESLLLSYLAEFGYTDFYYGLIPIDGNGKIRQAVEINTLPSNFVEHYNANRLQKSDPVVLHSRCNTAPLLWSDTRRQVERGVIKGAQAQTVRLTDEWGVGNGVTIPFHRIGVYVAGISFIADPRTSVEEQDELFLSHRDQLLELAAIFHAHVNRKELALDRCRLSHRQIEVLKWTEFGLMKDAVAHKLNISPHTVDTHFKLAKERLGAVNIADAVARAIRLGILD